MYLRLTLKQTHQPLKVKSVKFNIFSYKQIKSRYVTLGAGVGEFSFKNFSGKQNNI